MAKGFQGFKGYRGPRTKDGLPDRRTAQGRKAWAAATSTFRQSKKRSEAARRGWETRKREAPRGGVVYEPDEYEEIVEEPIETVGGKAYGKKGR